MKSKILEVTLETPRCRHVFFPCLGLTPRSFVDFMEIAKTRKDAVDLSHEFPDGIPGTVIRIDMEAGRLWIVEPLWEERWVTERQRLIAKGRELHNTFEVQSPYLPDVYHEIKRCHARGWVRFIAGELPEDLGVERGTEIVADKRDEQLSVMHSQFSSLCSVVEGLVASQKEMQTQVLALAKAAASK